MVAGRCSFCGNPADEVAYLVAGPRGVAICGDCAALADEVASEALKPPQGDLVLCDVSMLATMDERHGGLVGPILDAAVAIRRGKVSWIGRQRDLPSRYAELPPMSCGDRVVCPGFVDASARMLAGDEGFRPEPVEAVRHATDRVEAMLSRGITMLDLRAGGTADPTADTTLMAAARSAGDRLPSWVSVTWVVGGMSPHMVRSVMVPRAARLASAAEIVCVGEGIGTKIDAVSPLSPRVRVCRELGDGCLEDRRVLSVEGWSPRLAGSAVPAPVLEAAGVLEGWPMPARPLWDAGVRCALATGSGWKGRYIDGMGLPAALAAGLGGLEPEEVLWSITRGGALAVGDGEAGRIRMGERADLVILDTDDIADIVTTPDGDLAWGVIVGGSVIPK